MKRKNAIITLTTACAFFLLCASCTTMKPIDRVQPLSITVVDAVTKAPLSGIKLYRILEAYAPSDTFFFIFPNPEPRLNQRILIADEYVTDVNGRVQIDQKPLSLFMNEDVYYEDIVCNLDCVLNQKDLDDIKTKRQTKYQIYKFNIDMYIISQSKFYRPQSNYRGVNLLSGIADLRPEGFVEQSYYEDVDFLWSEVDWRSEAPRNIIIELKPYTSEDAAIIEQRREERDRRIMEEIHKRNGPQGE